jgi:hypothetical protein
MVTPSDRLRALVAEATKAGWRVDWDIGACRYGWTLRGEGPLDEEGRQDRAAGHLVHFAPQLAELVADMGEALMTEPFGPRKDPHEILARLDALFPKEEA